MSVLVWDQDGTRTYETGVDHGVLYLKDSAGAYNSGYAWNGLTAVNETPSGAEATDIYADNIKYLSLRSAETFGGTIEAYTYPEQFEQCDGSAQPTSGVNIYQQSRKPFGLSYRTLIGNDTDGQDHGYKIHCVYGATASPSERGYQTVNDSPEAITFSWEFTTTPVIVNNYKPTALLTIDSTKTSAEALKAIETILYGSATAEPRLPLPDEIIRIIEQAGQYTYTEAVPTYAYSAVTPVGTENPVTEGWYELSGSDYVLSADTSVDSAKTYYSRSISSNPQAEGWYEKVGNDYVLSTDTTYDTSKTYYVRTVG